MTGDSVNAVAILLQHMNGILRFVDSRIATEYNADFRDKPTIKFYEVNGVKQFGVNIYATFGNVVNAQSGGTPRYEIVNQSTRPPRVKGADFYLLRDGRLLQFDLTGVYDPGKMRLYQYALANPREVGVPELFASGCTIEKVVENVNFALDRAIEENANKQNILDRRISLVRRLKAILDES